MEQSPLLIVGVWQKKSAEVASKSKDRLIAAVTKGFDAMAAVLSNDSDPEEVDTALAYFNAERSVALKFDKAKGDSLRYLVHGLLQSLHVSLIEWTEERSLRKENGEIPTQAEQEPILCAPVISIREESRNSSNDIPNPSFPIEPKEENIDSHQSLPLDYQISASELMRDENMFKEEEMDNENMELVAPHSNPNFNHSLDHIDKNPGMDDAVHDSLNEQLFNGEIPALRTMQPSDIMDYQMNFDDQILGERDLPVTEPNSLNEGSVSVKDVAEAVESEVDEEERGLSAKDPIENGREEKEAVDHPTDTPKDTSDSVRNLKKKRSSRHMSRPMQYSESMDSDGDDGPSMKESRSQSSRKSSSKRKSYKGEKDSEDVIKKRRVSKNNKTELECPVCEYRTCKAGTWLMHLRLKHSTTPALAGLALLCECGQESLSHGHSRKCDHDNITVIRKRHGTILRLDDEKATPKCVLCEIYPKTAHGYVDHLRIHHKSTLKQNGVYLKCSCGLEVRWSCLAKLKHLDDCNPRQFSLHKLDGK